MVNKLCATAPDSTASGSRWVKAVHSKAPAAKLSKKSVLVLRKWRINSAASKTLPKPAAAVANSVAQAGWRGICSMGKEKGNKKSAARSGA